MLVTLIRLYCQTYANLAASEEYSFVSSDTHSCLPTTAVLCAGFYTHFSLVQSYVVHNNINIDFFLLLRAEISRLCPI